ncbi:MAG: hypothetical protein OXB86_00575 [Bdellovibrionales bacterium]|nr:hypothetical protein [Bdellovibrionales bacterium]
MRHLAALIVILFVSLTAHSQRSGNSSLDSSPYCFSPESKCNRLSEDQIQSYRREMCGHLSNTIHCMKSRANDLLEFEKCLANTTEIEIFIKDYLTFEDVIFLNIGLNKTNICLVVAYDKADDPLHALEHLKSCVGRSFDEVIESMGCGSVI